MKSIFDWEGVHNKYLLIRVGQELTLQFLCLQRVAGACHGDFGGVRQQDSHEFLTLLMDWLHDGLNKVTYVIKVLNIFPIIIF